MTTEMYAELMKVDTKANTNKFWNCEIVQTRNAGRTQFEVITHYGRIGTHGQRRSVGTYPHLQGAESEAKQRTYKKRNEGYNDSGNNSNVKQIDADEMLDELDDLDSMLAGIEV